jgi:CheY-like chemotaxis protein/nitrogen-specific signal transduction histidine kinase
VSPPRKRPARCARPVRPKATVPAAARGNCRESQSTVESLEERLTAALEALDDAQREVALASQAKRAFLSAMTHELKTPMNAVFGCARLMLETALTPEQREHSASALVAGEAMMAIIDDALDYSALERGELMLTRAPFDLVEMVEAVVTVDAGRAEEKGLDLAAVIDPALPPTVYGDAARVRQIARKLLANAITFTEAGSVLLRLSPVAGGGVRIEVEDTGIGVPSDTLAHVFDAFVQADTSTTRRHGGAGLGLAVCRRLTEAMGGTIGVSSTMGAGSRFWVELPLTAASHDAPPEPVFGGRHAVVLSTAQASRQAAETELRRVGFDVTLVGDAVATVDALTARPRSDLLVLDLRVGDIDALGLLLGTAALNTMPQAVVALAPRLERQALPSVLAPGATWLARPVQRRPLRETLGRVFGLEGESETAAESLGSLRILAADDYPINLRVVTRLLEKRGHTVETVTTGAAAAAAVLASHYDLVLMDCRMPEMDGYEATEQIRAQEGTRRRTPIIALTANDGEADRQRCFDVGMDAFVAKPLRPAELFSAIDRVMAGAASRAVPSSAPAPSADLPALTGDAWEDLARSITALTHSAEMALTHVSEAGGTDIRAVLRAAIRARDLAHQLRPAALPAAVGPVPGASPGEAA